MSHFNILQMTGVKLNLIDSRQNTCLVFCWLFAVLLVIVSLVTEVIRSCAHHFDETMLQTFVKRFILLGLVLTLTHTLCQKHLFRRQQTFPLDNKVFKWQQCAFLWVMGSGCFKIGSGGLHDLICKFQGCGLSTKVHNTLVPVKVTERLMGCSLMRVQTCSFLFSCSLSLTQAGDIKVGTSELLGWSSRVVFSSVSNAAIFCKWING